MGANKRQQTMAKMRREQAVREKRALKQEKKKAARLAKAEGILPGEPGEDQQEAGDETLDAAEPLDGNPAD
jgi:hypothetical protein